MSFTVNAMNYQFYLSNLFMGIYGGQDEDDALNNFAMSFGHTSFDALCDTDTRYTRAAARLVALPQLETLDGQPEGTYIEVIHRDNDKDKETLFFVGPFDDETHAEHYIVMLTADTMSCIVHHEGD